MKNFILFCLLILTFTSCSQKMFTKVEVTNDVLLKKVNSKEIFINYFNQTNEDVRVYDKLKRELKLKGYKIVNNLDEAKYSLDLNLIFASEITKRSTTKNILSNVNLGVSIGQVFGNVGVSGNIGTKIGTILGDSLDSESYQMIFDVTIKEFKENNDFDETITQIVAETIIDEKPLQYTIDILEDEVTKEVAKFF